MTSSATSATIDAIFQGNIGAGSFEADDAVDDDQRHVNSGGPEMAGHRFGKAALGSLGRGEGGRPWHAAARRRCTDHDDAAGALPLHRRNDLLRAEEKPERID